MQALFHLDKISMLFGLLIKYFIPAVLFSLFCANVRQVRLLTLTTFSTSPLAPYASYIEPGAEGSQSLPNQNTSSCPSPNPCNPSPTQDLYKPYEGLAGRYIALGALALTTMVVMMLTVMLFPNTMEDPGYGGDSVWDRCCWMFRLSGKSRITAPLIGYSYSNCVERNIDLGKIVYRNLHSQVMLLQGCLTK